LRLLPQRVLRAKDKESERAHDLFKEVLDHPTRYLGDQKALGALAEAIKNGKLRLDSTDPRIQEFKKLLEKIGPNSPLAGHVAPQQMEKLREMVKKLSGDSAAPGAADAPPASASPAPGVAPQTATGATTSENSPPDASAAAREAPAAPPEEPAEGTPLARWVLRNAEWLSQKAGPLSQSPALQEAIAELTSGRRGEQGAAGPSALASGLNSKLASLVDRTRSWIPEDSLEKLKELPWPSLSEMKRLGRWKLPAGSLPSLGSATPPALPTARGSGSSLTWVALGLLLVGAGILTVVLYRQKLVQERQRSGTQELGPWPVSPEMVASREDLVRAFEYLSVLKLGPGSRSWNHRWIATQMAVAESNGCHAIGHLATLYEQARYAPAEDVLSEEAFRTARRDLCSLAGVAAR
jgi:hypothetical protein